MIGAEAAGKSALYARYNGGMFGYFFAGSLARHTAPRYPVLRARMNQFLEEIGALPIMPPQPVPIEAGPRLMKELMFTIHTVAPEVAEAAFLTGLSFFHVLLRDMDPETSATCGQEARKRLAQYGLDEEILTAFAASFEADDDLLPANHLHSAGLSFLSAILSPLEPCPHTTFVAMPFAAPHDTYFSTFYQPMLARLGRSAIRAWGGLASEDYQRLVHVLIGKSQGVLADLTTQNINVIHEVGLAEGMGKPVALITAIDDAMPPSNIADLAIIKYDRSEPGWEAQAIQTCATMIALSQVAIDPANMA